MKYRTRIYYSEEQKSLMWDRWQQGDSLHAIARLFDRSHGSIAGILSRTGGIRPPERKHSQLALSMAEREMIVVATSARNQCQYCVIAHGAILRIRARNPYIADQLATNYRKADISVRQKAMLDYALKVSREAETVDESDYQKLNEFGFDDEDIWDIGAISAFFGLSNRIVNMSSMRTNDEFYLMGRVPREK